MNEYECRINKLFCPKHLQICCRTCEYHKECEEILKCEKNMIRECLKFKDEYNKKTNPYFGGKNKWG